MINAYYEKLALQKIEEQNKPAHDLFLFLQFHVDYIGNRRVPTSKTENIGINSLEYAAVQMNQVCPSQHECELLLKELITALK